jgi:serine protease Do
MPTQKCRLVSAPRPLGRFLLKLGRHRRRELPGAAFLLFLLVLAAAFPAAAATGEKDEDPIQGAVRSVLATSTPAFVFIGGGSGVLISPDGEFLTNQHVAFSSKRWQVRLADGRIVTARKVGADPYGDVALLKIEGARQLPYVPLGDSDALQPGEPVIALGNPFALGGVLGGQKGDPSVSVGIVSALHRRQGTYLDAIQTDASINPGNSGGPLINLRGELVGINGRIASRYGNRINSGVGFAIPINQIRRFLPIFRAGGPAYHGMIEGLHVAHHPHAERVVHVTAVLPGSPAARSGFRAGDGIVRVDRYPTPTWSRFTSVVSSFPEGADLDVTVRRGTEEKNLMIRLGRLQDVEAEIRFVAQTVPTELGVRVDDAPAGGVALVDVEPGSPAADAGLKVEDVLARLNGRRVNGRLDYFLVLRWTRPGQTVPVEILRGGERLEVRLQLRRRGGEGEEADAPDEE